MDLIKTKKKREPKYYQAIEERRERLLKIVVPDLPNEQWYDISGYEGHYMISNFARIKSVGRVVGNGKGTSVVKPSQIFKGGINSDGYWVMRLTANTVSKTHSLHVLVARLFVPNPHKLLEVNHKDGNKLNCLPSNLEWVTRSQNMAHSVATSLRVYKKGNSHKRINQDDIIIIYNSKEQSGELAKKYNVTKSSIQRIRSGKTYASLTKNLQNGLNKQP